MMANFARVNGSIVQMVVFVDNAELLLNGVESEETGIQFLKETFGVDTEWVQTSYNAASNGFRGIYASIGDVWTGTEFIPATQETP